MNLSRQATDSGRHAFGFCFVVVLHAFVAYALVTGLAKKVVDVVRAPIETKVIEEIKKQPLPPEEVLLPPPPMQPPPPAYVPPPEVKIQAPPTQPVITATPTPPAVEEFKPLAPAVVPASAPAKPVPARVSAQVVCSNYAAVMDDVAYPREAQRLGIDKGDALVQFVVATDGKVKDMRVLRASHPVFARAGLRIVGEYRCQGRDHDVVVEVPIAFQLL